MRRSLSRRFVDKAQAALTSAVEVYNKPAFAYREETFSLLALNAWELLVKARILSESGNKASAIRLYRPRRTKGGRLSTKLYVVRNRSGNPQTISLGEAITTLDRQHGVRLDPAVRANIWALTEIRDNSAHYVTASPVLAKQTLEIGAASVKNFVLLARDWFGQDLSRTLSLFLPLSFISGTAEVESVVVSADERRLLQHLNELAAINAIPGSDFAVALNVDVKLERSTLSSSPRVRLSSDSDALKITLSEEDFRRTYPWSYKELSQRLTDRYSDFKQNSKYHVIRKALQPDPRFAGVRYLDSDNPHSAHQLFFNPNILQEFDDHYTRR